MSRTIAPRFRPGLRLSLPVRFGFRVIELSLAGTLSCGGADVPDAGLADQAALVDGSPRDLSTCAPFGPLCIDLTDDAGFPGRDSGLCPGHTCGGPQGCPPPCTFLG